MCEGIEKLFTITTMVEIISEYVIILSTGEKRIAEKQKVTLYQEYKWSSCVKYNFSHFFRDHVQNLASA